MKNPETVGENQDPRLPIETPIPTLGIIAIKMAAKFGKAMPLMEEMVTPCAEVAESLLFELSQTLHRKYAKQLPTKETLVKRTGYWQEPNGPFVYYCTNCRSQAIRHSHVYCPHCGYKIIWVSGVKEHHSSANAKELPQSDQDKA